MIHIEVVKHKNESSASLLRRFTKKTQGSSLIRRAKENRFYTRKRSRFVKKKEALARLARKKEHELLWKLGKIDDAYGKKSR